MLATDFNQDGNLDLLAVGNSYATETATGYYDASIGTCLAGTGKGTFKPLGLEASGFTVTGDAKAMVQLYTASHKPLVVVSQNADSLKVFSQTSKKPDQFIPLKPQDAHARLHFKNGSKRREEFNYGSGYLSQSARALTGTDLAAVYITDYQGKSRPVKLSSALLALKPSRVAPAKSKQ